MIECERAHSHNCQPHHAYHACMAAMAMLLQQILQCASPVQGTVSQDWQLCTCAVDIKLAHPTTGSAPQPGMCMGTSSVLKSLLPQPLCTGDCAHVACIHSMADIVCSITPASLGCEMQFQRLKSVRGPSVTSAKLTAQKSFASHSSLTDTDDEEEHHHALQPRAHSISNCAVCALQLHGSQ